jgi:NAD-dependent SIR2 family protein deacetylase
VDDPELAWGFYGHRLELYRRTTPHRGFGILRRLAERSGRFFVFTSNVDGHFQRAGVTTPAAAPRPSASSGSWARRRREPA